MFNNINSPLSHAWHFQVRFGSLFPSLLQRLNGIARMYATWRPLALPHAWAYWYTCVTFGLYTLILISYLDFQKKKNDMRVRSEIPPGVGRAHLAMPMPLGMSSVFAYVLDRWYFEHRPKQPLFCPVKWAQYRISPQFQAFGLFVLSCVSFVYFTIHKYHPLVTV